ncbi:MAG: DUF6226 family protein [Actinomycetota bacterium]|uniref:DUF6226 family protein n=1 Tax=Micrococcus yunnanensis TaxID=566027 RepID=A0AAP5T8A8_9MICC|nr:MULTISPECIES: DUF6226 family protein [Micrococcus]MBF0756052.1 hypothetical protein [Micrococcus aloeverae]MDV7177430.1 DUF6226 family protein [Micrococcus yunnanensis]TFU81731.1 hypothetical protein E4T87_06240 [Micrococcus aloeverae]
MTTLQRLCAEVARRYAALDLPAWPDPHPDGAPPREEEYSRVTEPQRYRIAAARARVWAEVLAEVGAAVAPDPVRGIPLDEAGRADLSVPVDRALRVAPPAGVDGASPWWLLETDVPQDDDGGVLPVLRGAVGAPGQVHAVLPDCGCDACDPGSDELLEAVDQAAVRAVGAGVSLRGRHGLRRRDWHVHWRSDGTAEGLGRVPGWPFEALTDACRDLAAGGRPRLPRGTEATVRAGWFPEA